MEHVEAGEIVKFRLGIGGIFAIPPRKLKQTAILPLGDFEVVSVNSFEREATVRRMADGGIIHHVPLVALYKKEGGE